MRLDHFDLNLLVAFHALLEERNVSRAAERLNVTQSAMSASLKRLREAFGDELLVRSGRNMVPTATALELAPRIAAQLLDLRSLISSGTAFDPATSTRRFRIAASDYIATVLLAPLQKVLEGSAPAIGLEITLPAEDTAERLAKGEFDLILTPEEFIAPDQPAELVFEERQVVVGWNENPLLSRPLGVGEFACARHIAVRIDGRNTYVENALDRLSLQLRVEVIAPSFIQLPHFLPGTMRIALMHERLARHMAAILPLAIAEPPVAIPPMREMAQYHGARASDAGLAWLLRGIRDVASRV